MQMRALQPALSSHFRIVFAEAPFVSSPGPDVLTVFADCGPFKRWMGWLPEHYRGRENGLEEEKMGIREVVERTMREDDEKGACGDWVAWLGFSQGAKVAACLLWGWQEFGRPYLEGGKGRENWKFAILMAGRAPIIDLDEGEETKEEKLKRKILKLPTVHVHGLMDPGLDYHRELLEDWCQEGTTRLVEWEGDHRLPIKKADVQAVVRAVHEVAKETGVIKQV